MENSSKRKRESERDREKDDEKTEPQTKKGKLSSLPLPPAPATPKAQPIPIDVLKKVIKEQQDSKPVFMTAAERKRLAEELKRAQEEEEKQKQKAIKEARESFFKQATQEERSYSSRRDDRDDRRGRRDRRDRDDRYRDRDRDRDRERDRDKGKERNDRDRNDRDRRKRDRDDRRRSPRSDRDEEKKEDMSCPLTDKEKTIIKNQYLGLNKEKKKLIKPSEKFQYKPSWDLSDDTSYDLNPLYAQRLEITPLCSFKSDPLDKNSVRKRGSRSTTIVEETHWSEKRLEDMTERDWRIFKEDFGIGISGGGGLPQPMRNWDESPLPESLKKTIKDIGYKMPTPIQMAAIPIALQGRDILGVAQTGSGKTAAFLLPLLVHISALPPLNQDTASQGPYALILAPTRDLVLQIHSEAVKFAANTNIRVTAVLGGKSLHDQALLLGSGTEIIVATPNRLFDCLERRYVVFNQCYHIILDEADEMISMGFEPQVLRILESMPESRWKSENETEAEMQEKEIGQYAVVSMYSATMPVQIERLSRKYLRRAVSITIESENQLNHIEQRVIWTRSDSDKKKYLLELLEDRATRPPIMIFTNRKVVCDTLCEYLSGLRWRVAVLHSGKSQEQREYALNSFKSGKYDVLVSTDVLGRGIDVPGVTHVINFDMPDNIEDYTHRIGRTGRAGKTGIAVSYLMPTDAEIMYDLKKLLQKTGSKVPSELKTHPASKVKQERLVRAPVQDQFPGY